MESTELAATFDRAVAERLLAAETLVFKLPELFRGTLMECDLAYREFTRLFVAVVRIDPKAQARGRLEFWTARAGGRFLVLSTLPERDRAAFHLYVGECDLRRMGVAPQDVPEAVGQIVTEAGAPEDRRRPEPGPPVLAIDVGGPGWEGVRYSAADQQLFIPGAIAPLVGDWLVVALRFTGIEYPLETRAQVSQVRALDQVQPGEPAGFTLQLVSPPPALLQALAEAPVKELVKGSTQRSAPRYPLKAPVKIASSGRPGAKAASTAHIEYATEQELAADYVENLSQGGAFVRTGHPHPVGTRLTLHLRLPGDIELKAPATAVFVDPMGMGVKFELDEDGQEVLAGVIAHISARPRRALVVDDDALARRMIADALTERGFEVVSASNGGEGLRILTEEILALDLLVTDLIMPSVDGETFVKTIRKAGGEDDLTIVVISGRLEPGIDSRLEVAGVDAVLDKSLGPELIAQAADAAMERKRMVKESA